MRDKLVQMQMKQGNLGGLVLVARSNDVFSFECLFGDDEKKRKTALKKARLTFVGEKKKGQVKDESLQ